MRKALDWLYEASLGLAGLFLVGIFLVMVGEAVLRKSGSYITGASDLIGWFCAAAGFLALPATFKRGDMVRVGMLVDALPAGVRKPMLVGSLLLGVVFTAYMLQAAAGYMWRGWLSGETTQGMIEIAAWIPKTSLLVGVLLLLVSLVDECIVVLRAPADTLRAERPMSLQDAVV